MSFESPADEVLIIEEVEGKSPTKPTRGGPTWPRVAGIVIGSIGLSAAVSTIVRRLISSRQGARGRRRGTRFELRPRVGIFAPTMNISLPFSSIITPGQMAHGRANGRRPARVRGQTARRGWRAQRPATAATRRWRFARRMPVR